MQAARDSADAVLPSDLLPLVLAHVPLRDRLQHCAAVSTAWRTAAVAATTSISAQLQSVEQRDAFVHWLQQHGQAAAVQQLSLSGRVQGEDEPEPEDWEAWYDDGELFMAVQLPVAQLGSLRSLSARHLKIMTAAADEDAPAGQAARPSYSFAALSSLTSLSLEGGAVNLDGLAAATGLRELDLHCLLGWSLGNKDPPPYMSALQQLSQLTKLRISDDDPTAGATDSWCTMAFEDADVACLSSLTKLQDFDLVTDGVTAASLNILPTTLTRLKLGGLMSKFDADGLVVKIHTGTCPNFAKLTKLRHLDVSSMRAAGLAPAMLSGMVDLQELKAARVSLLHTPGHPLGLSSWTALTALHTLEMWGMLPPEKAAMVSLADCSALTASSHLTRLDLGFWELSEAQWLEVFPPGRRLLQMRELFVHPSLFSSGAAAAQLARCCPQLTSLLVADEPAGGASPEVDGGSAQPLAALSAIQQLTDLKDLSLIRVAPSAADWLALAQLQGLQELFVLTSAPTLFSGAMQLTSCTALTSLSLQVAIEGVSLTTYGSKGAAALPAMQDLGLTWILAAMGKSDKGLPPCVCASIPVSLVQHMQEQYEGLQERGLIEAAATLAAEGRAVLAALESFREVAAAMVAEGQDRAGMLDGIVKTVLEFNMEKVGGICVSPLELLTAAEA